MKDSSNQGQVNMPLRSDIFGQKPAPQPKAKPAPILTHKINPIEVEEEKMEVDSQSSELCPYCRK